MVRDDGEIRPIIQVSRNSLSLPHSEKALEVHKERNDRFQTHLQQFHSQPILQGGANTQWKDPVARKWDVHSDQKRKVRRIGEVAPEYISRTAVAPILGVIDTLVCSKNETSVIVRNRNHCCLLLL